MTEPLDLDGLEEALAAGRGDALLLAASRLLAMARVIEALPSCSACDWTRATNVLWTAESGLFWGCDAHRSPGAEDLPWAEQIRALGEKPFADVCPPPVAALLERRGKVLRDAAERARREGLTPESFATFMDTVAPGWRAAAPAVPDDASPLPEPGVVQSYALPPWLPARKT